MLMFGTFAALREALPAYHVDYRERLSADPAVRWTDRLAPDGTWESNLFQFFMRVVQRLSADPKIERHLKKGAFRGWELVQATAGVCAMNLMLHGIGSDRHVPVMVADVLAAGPGERFDVVPASGRRGRRRSGSTTCAPTSTSS